MGKDKSLLPFGRYTTLIEYQYKKLSKIFSNVYISSKTNKFNFIEKEYLILDDEIEISSPMIALQSILKKFNNKVFIITVDTPLIKKSTFIDLIDRSNQYDITIATANDKVHNLCGVFSTSLLVNINNLVENDNHKINYLVKNTNTFYVLYDDVQQFLNLNTKEEYKKALSIISITNDNY